MTGRTRLPVGTSPLAALRTRYTRDRRFRLPPPPEHQTALEQPRARLSSLGTTHPIFLTRRLPRSTLLAMPKPLHLVTLIGWVAVLNGCGYPPPDRVQILANTIPPGGSCTVSRGGQLIGHVDSTPGIVLVPNEEADYVVACRRNAYQEMGTIVHARTETTSPLYYFGSKELHSRGGASVTFTLVPSVAPRL
jgi:hypothetical protein